MRIKTLIIEDEVNARKALKNMLEFYCPEIEVCGEASSVSEGKALLKKSEAQLVFMDIQLPDGTAFDILKKGVDNSLKIIFITAFDAYALQAIKLSALDYILKPPSPKELIKAVNKVREAIENEELLSMQIETVADNLNDATQNRKIILNVGSKMHIVLIEQIVRAEAKENYSMVTTINNEHILASKSMKELDEMLASCGFFRVHHSHLINLSQIDTYDKAQALCTLRNGDQVPVSTRRREAFLKALETFF